MTYICSYFSPVGELILESDGKFLTGLWMDSFPGRDKGTVIERDNLDIFLQTRKCLNRYFSGETEDFSSIPLLLTGSDFQILVYEILSMIPYGQVWTYKDVAVEVLRRTGKKRMSCQAIGGAVGKNPISILIPCHRVVGQKGNLVGYGGGIQRKIFLLQLEGIDISSYYIPKDCRFL